MKQERARERENREQKTTRENEKERLDEWAAGQRTHAFFIFVPRIITTPYSVPPSFVLRLARAANISSRSGPGKPLFQRKTPPPKTPHYFDGQPRDARGIFARELFCLSEAFCLSYFARWSV